MKKEICLSCLTVCTILLACSTPSEKSLRSAASVIPVDLEHAGALQASQWFDTIMYVPLETSDSFLFSNISHLKVSHDQNIYFISDKSFFLFDGHTGKGKLKISRLGTGPDGYASLFDSYIDPETQEIELLDNNGKKIVVYDKEGNHLRSFAIPFMSFTLTKTDQHNYWFYNNNLPSEACNYKVAHYNRITEKSEEAYDSIDPHLAEYFFIEDEKNLVTQGNSMLYHASPTDTVYRIQPGKGMEAAYILDMGKNKAPQTFYSNHFKDIMEFVETANKHDYVFELPTLAANDSLIAIGCMKQGQLYITLHASRNEKTVTFSAFQDDFHFSAPLPLDNQNIPFCLDNEFLYLIITAEQLTDWQKEGDRKELMNEWMKQQHINEYSNPILMKCRLK